MKDRKRAEQARVKILEAIKANSDDRETVNIITATIREAVEEAVTKVENDRHLWQRAADAYATKGYELKQKYAQYDAQKTTLALSALEPFAKLAEFYNGEYPDKEALPTSRTQTWLKVAQLRTARDTYVSLGGKL